MLLYKTEAMCYNLLVVLNCKISNGNVGNMKNKNNSRLIYFTFIYTYLHFKRLQVLIYCF